MQLTKWMAHRAPRATQQLPLLFGCSLGCSVTSVEPINLLRCLNTTAHRSHMFIICFLNFASACQRRLHSAGTILFGLVHLLQVYDVIAGLRHDGDSRALEHTRHAVDTACGHGEAVVELAKRQVA